MSDGFRSGYIPITILLVTLLLLVSPVTADEWVGGVPLETVQTGTVTGDLWFDIDPAPDWGSKNVTKTFTLPAAAVEGEGRIAWARLYVSAYCGHMQNDYAFQITNRFDGDGNGEYEHVWTETNRSGFNYVLDPDTWEPLGNDNTALGGGPNDPYKIYNDHENRVTSDYFMWYDVTDLLKSQTVNVNVNTGDSYDGRIKTISLVVAYDDPSSATETTYWVNQGHDVCSYYVEDNFGRAAVGTTTFGTGSLSGTGSARLTVSYMASNNGYYGFPTAENDFVYTAGTPPVKGTFTNELDRTPDVQGPYSGVASWDVTDKVTGSDNVTLGYARHFPGTGTAAFYKIPLAFLVVKRTLPPPVANFSANVTAGDAPLAVQFTDLSTNAPTSWLWDFGDSATSTGQNATHIYATAGTYTVTLTATNAAGSDSEVKTGYITVTPGGEAPVAAFTATPLTGLAPLSVIFTDASSDSPTAWSWASRPSGTDENWTAFSAEQNANYNFEAGAYDIRLTVSNADGSSTATKTQYISSSAGAKRLATVQNGTVSGDLYVGAYGGYSSGTSYATNTLNRTFTLPAYTDVQWARLYTVVYASGTDNRTGTATVRFDGDGDGTYETLGTETLATAADNTASVYPVNDHVNRQYSDYLLWYDVTGLIDSQSPKAEVVSTPVASTFDGRIKELVLVVAYNDGDGDEVHYWVNDGHDYQANGAGGVTSTFATGGLAAGWADATLRNVMLSSRDARYTFNGAACIGENSTSYFGTNTWDVRNNLTAGSDSSFAYVPNGGSYKTTLATLAVKYPVSGGDAPDLAVSTLASNNGEVFSAAGNTYTATITNIGTADATGFAVGFNVSGVTGTVAVADGLAAGANATVAWTDETVRTAGDLVTVTVVTDVNGAIAEADEENNLRSIEKTVVHNGYRGTRWTGGDDLNTTATYDVRGDLLWSAGDGAYLSASSNWAAYTVNWTAGDLPVPANATIAAARLYVPYTWDKGPVFPANVSLTFNGVAVEQAAFYADEKMWGTSYPYGMTVYDVTAQFSADGNAALLENAYPGGGNVSVRGMLLAVVYDDGTAAPHTVVMNEGFDLLYGGTAQSTTPEQATAYAPFAAVESGAVGARLVTVAPGAGPTEGDLLFNSETWTNAWNYTGTTQIGVDERNVTALLAGENTAAFRSDADWMEAAAAFLVVEYPAPPGSIAVASTPAGAAVRLDGAETGLVTPITLENVPAGDHVVTVKKAGYADASMTVAVLSGETATVDLALTTLTGSLTVTSTPEGARIFLDGADTGTVTNATLDGIAVGTHTVTVTKEGYRGASAEIEIAYNQTATLHLDLVEAAGSIAVTSEPAGAAIFLDGTDTGRTTNALLEDVPAGDHVVTVKKTGYADASRTATVADNEIAAVAFALTEPVGSILVTSTPDGARIFLDDADTGEVTNATLANVPVGDHTVRVSLDGYLDAEETVTVAAGATASVRFDLATPAIRLVPGWNFVSTPKRLADGQDTIAIFDGVDSAAHSVLYYNGTGRWEAMSSQAAFKPLDGIWIYANTSYTIPLAFAAGSMQAPPTKDLDAGWNAIGFSDTVPEPAVTALRSVEPAWTTLFGFNADEQEYDVSIIRGATGRHGETRELAPFRGYWLYMNEADTLAAIGV